MAVRLLLIAVSTCFVGALVYAGCVIWPLQMLKPTGLIAAISVSFGWALVGAVFLDSRKSRKD
ncbi:hypothetical protein [Desulfosediminicola flagellatus]|uniref:hypothetical protein n=1 Tax=Desulfosediminicola flagellatus TaxID=2569541 RepID=UPI0010ABEFF5|nr:hypothetical protein [Desulfosediminicola flagellatus]